jgi:hypothetical protein
LNPEPGVKPERSLVTRAEKKEEGAPNAKPAGSESIYYRRNFAKAGKIIGRL